MTDAEEKLREEQHQDRLHDERQRQHALLEKQRLHEVEKAKNAKRPDQIHSLNAQHLLGDVELQSGRPVRVSDKVVAARLGMSILAAEGAAQELVDTGKAHLVRGNQDGGICIQKTDLPNELKK